MLFIASAGGGNECPLTAGSLDAAEIDFVRTCGLTPERASALRTELDRNKVVSVQTSIDAAVAARFATQGRSLNQPGADTPLAVRLRAWTKHILRNFVKRLRSTENFGNLFALSALQFAKWTFG